MLSLCCCAGFFLVAGSEGTLDGKHGLSARWTSVTVAHASVVVVPGLWGIVAVVMVCRLSCFASCEIFPNQRWNPCLLNWQADSLWLSYLGSPVSSWIWVFLMYTNHNNIIVADWMQKQKMRIQLSFIRPHIKEIWRNVKWCHSSHFILFYIYNILYFEKICLSKECFAVQSLNHVWLCKPMDHSTSGFPVLHYILEFGKVHVHWVNNDIQ